MRATSQPLITSCLAIILVVDVRGDIGLLPHGQDGTVYPVVPDGESEKNENFVVPASRTSRQVENATFTLHCT